MRLFGSKKAPATTSAPPVDGYPDEPAQRSVAEALNRKEVEIYPRAVKLLWFYYDPEDQGKPEGREKEFPGPTDEVVDSCVKELEKANLIQVVPTFSDFGITAKLTRLGLAVMADQKQVDHLSPVELHDPGTRAVTVIKEVRLGLG